MSAQINTDVLTITAAVVEEPGGPFEIQHLELDTDSGP